jgi:hypothetical protein
VEAIEHMLFKQAAEITRTIQFEAQICYVKTKSRDSTVTIPVLFQEVPCSIFGYRNLAIRNEQVS